MKIKLTIKDLSDIKQVAHLFIEKMGDNIVFAFYGDMAVGKTTFIKALCEGLGVTETVSSPTFAIINEYRYNQEKSIYYFDFYRINKLEEVYDFGYEDYFYSGNICFIEWPEIVEQLLPNNTVRISIREQEDGSRVVESLLPR